MIYNQKLIHGTSQVKKSSQVKKFGLQTPMTCCHEGVINNKRLDTATQHTLTRN